ncbi:MAG: tryptophan synthase subunit alpha [Pirellulaceae bacterium]|nr:tryptophan synthase subunit alpha [Pirellulaceae bacterium]
MSAVDDCFARLRSQGKKAFLPFVTAGDPSLAVTAQLLQVLQEAGCALAELGIPYSDPIADGPVIQDSYARALNSGIKLREIMQMVSQAKSHLTMPLVSMISYSIIQRIGADKFLDDSLAAGLAGSIVPDLLVEEADDLRQRCRARDYSLIHLVTPTTPPDRMLRIAESSSGFIYFVSVTGITGVRTELPADVVDRVAWLRERTELPICIGFGISRPEHVRLLAPVADGLIVGSAIVRALAEHSDIQQGLAAVRTLVQQLIAALAEYTDL